MNHSHSEHEVDNREINNTNFSDQNMTNQKEFFVRTVFSLVQDRIT